MLRNFTKISIIAAMVLGNVNAAQATTAEVVTKKPTNTRILDMMFDKAFTMKEPLSRWKMMALGDKVGLLKATLLQLAPCFGTP